MPIPVIDLFAGPGGLSEGFAAIRRGRERVFKIQLSVEKDIHAHRTLELRAFYRQFPDEEAPDEYYRYLAGSVSREELFGRFPDEAKRSQCEAWHAELGSKNLPPENVEARVCLALG